MPGKGATAPRDRRDDPRAARSAGCSRSASTRSCRSPTPPSRARRSSGSTSSSCIDFFLSETARHADLVLPGSLQEEDEGTVTSAEGRVDPHPAGGRAAGRGAARLGDHLRAGASGSAHGERFAFTSPDEIFDELRRLSTGGVADYAGITYEKIERQHGRLLAVSRRRSIPARRGSSRADASSIPTGARASTPSTTGRRRRTSTPSTRSSSPPAAWCRSSCRGTQTRRIGPLVDQYPEPKVEIHPRLARRLGITRRRPRAGREPARRRSSWRRTSSRRSGPTPSSSRTTGPAKQSANRLTRARLRSDRGHPRVQGRGRAHREAADPAEARVMIGELFIDPKRCIGCRACVRGVQRVPRARRRSR